MSIYEMMEALRTESQSDHMIWGDLDQDQQEKFIDLYLSEFPDESHDLMCDFASEDSQLVEALVLQFRLGTSFQTNQVIAQNFRSSTKIHDAFESEYKAYMLNMQTVAGML